LGHLGESCRELVQVRIAAELPPQLGLRAPRLGREVMQVDGDAHLAAVLPRAHEVVADPPRRERREPQLAPVVEARDRLDEADVALLDEVIHREVRVEVVAVAADRRRHQQQVAGGEQVADLFGLGGDRSQLGAFLRQWIGGRPRLDHARCDHARGDQAIEVRVAGVAGVGRLDRGLKLEQQAARLGRQRAGEQPSDRRRPFLRSVKISVFRVARLTSRAFSSSRRISEVERACPSASSPSTASRSDPLGAASSGGSGSSR
jgi:hypothetical protein